MINRIWMPLVVAINPLKTGDTYMGSTMADQLLSLVLPFSLQSMQKINQLCQRSCLINPVVKGLRLFIDHKFVQYV